MPVNVDMNVLSIRVTFVDDAKNELAENVANRKKVICF